MEPAVLDNNDAVLGPVDLSRLTVLAGAGISIDAPSWIPAGQALGDALVQWATYDAPKHRPTFEALRMPPHTRRPYAGPYATLRFELLLEWLSYVKPGLLDILSVLDDGGFANLWHHHLATAIGRGAVVLTTNFDTRIEEACEDQHATYRRAVVSAAVPSARRLAGARLVKLHGTFPSADRHGNTVGATAMRTAPVTTLSQIARFGLGFSRRPDMCNVLHRLLSEGTVLVVGYSGWDSFDVMPLLEDSNARSILLWHVWRAEGPLTIARVSPDDPMLVTSRDADPSTLFLADRARREGPTFRLEGPTAALFAALWPRDAADVARCSLEHAVSGLDLTGFGAAENIAEFSNLLLRPENRMAADACAYVVDALTESYGMNGDSDVEPTRPGRSGNESPSDRTPGVTLEKIKPLIDAEDFLAAHQVFLDSIAVPDPRGDDTAYNEVVAWITEDMFWRAFKASRPRQALLLARRLAAVARRRRILWAEVRAMFLEAEVYNRWSVTAQRGRMRYAPEHYLHHASVLLDKVLRYSLRIPRIDMFLDALRLRQHLEFDEHERTRLEAAQAAWLNITITGSVR